MNVPAAAPVYTVQYQNFTGVDFSSSIPERRRFPAAKNFVIADDVSKRNGYELVGKFKGRINGIYKFVLRRKEYILVHEGTKLHRVDDNFRILETLSETINDDKSKGICAEDKFIIATGKELISFALQASPENVDFIVHTVTGPFEWRFYFSTVYGSSIEKIYYEENGEEINIPASDFKNEMTNEGSANYHRMTFNDTEAIRRALGKTLKIYVNAHSSAISDKIIDCTLPEKLYSYVPIRENAGDYFSGYFSSLPVCDNDLAYDIQYVDDALDPDVTLNVAAIPESYKDKTVYIPFVSSKAYVDMNYDDIGRLHHNVFIISEAPELDINYIYSASIPTYRAGIKYISIDSTWDVVSTCIGERTTEEINLASPYVIYDGNDFYYNYLSSGGYPIYVEGNACVDKAWFLFDGHILKEVSLEEKSYIVSNITHKVTFAIYDSNALEGKSFKIICKIASSKKLYEENEIWKCKEIASLQYGNGIYYFFARNEKFPNRDWHSAINDPMNIPSTNYTIYGVSDKILGYAQYGKYLAVFKEGATDTNIYVRSSMYTDEFGVTFPVDVGVGGAVPGISLHSIANLAGESLYLTNDGIYALTSLSTTDFQVTRKRSYFIDGKLKKEPNLSTAIATTWKGMYLLGVNGNVYVLDGTQPKVYVEGTANEYSYECLFWDNIPARIFFAYGDDLYFGTEDGQLLKFNDGFTDYSPEGDKPVELIVSTVFDDDGDFMSLKKMMKKGTGILVNPFIKSSFDIAFRYDDLKEISVKRAYADIFTFDDVDFERFTFNTSENPRVIPFLKKSKKYRSLQIILKSCEDEPFSLLRIIKRYTLNNYVKK